MGRHSTLPIDTSQARRAAQKVGKSARAVIEEHVKLRVLAKMPNATNFSAKWQGQILTMEFDEEPLALDSAP